ncbi:unannotated protein [freshwater metagenome]|uniref:Unannotated protein n=1 Tax=freshwater metagenome TaxID=449393 RepID=A0A6J6I8B3_9ZZZZ
MHVAWLQPLRSDLCGGNGPTSTASITAPTPELLNCSLAFSSLSGGRVASATRRSEHPESRSSTPLVSPLCSASSSRGSASAKRPPASQKGVFRSMPLFRPSLSTPEHERASFHECCQPRECAGLAYFPTGSTCITGPSFSCSLQTARDCHSFHCSLFECQSPLLLLCCPTSFSRCPYDAALSFQRLGQPALRRSPESWEWLSARSPSRCTRQPVQSPTQT